MATTEQPSLSDLSDRIQALLENLDYLEDEQLRELFQLQQELGRRLSIDGPQTDDELHAWIKEEMGIDVPRGAVCADHDPPFDFLADLFFERTDAALLMANRGGSKTFLVAVLHWINSKFKAGCESCTFGATEAQSLRCYAHLKGWIYDRDGEKRPEIAQSIMRETTWRNGSKVEVLPGTKSAVNGPHPQKAHADEIELMDDETWSESRNMTISKRLDDGRMIKPQDIATSTRKGPNGRMQQLIDEITEAVRAGYKPPRKLYQWCIKETAAQVPNCQVANPNLPDNEKCECHTVRQGEWDDGSDRLLLHICQGDFHKSRGWQPYHDVVKQFRENDRETFEVQQLCEKPEMKWHYLPTFSQPTHGVRSYLPDPRNGPIFTSVDWGGTNPHAVNWYQRLDFEIEALNFYSDIIRIKEGSIVCFDEIYIAEIGNDKLAEMVMEREDDWNTRVLKATDGQQRFYVEERFADPQGKAAKLDWRDKGLKTSWHTTRDFEEHIKVVKPFVENKLFFVDVERCPMFCREAVAWRRDPKTGNQIDEHNHAMSNFRYALANIRKVIAKRKRKAVPATRSVHRTAPRLSSQRGVPALGSQGSEYDQWRKSLGAPLTQRPTR